LSVNSNSRPAKKNLLLTTPKEITRGNFRRQKKF
jgi:hypothetical protein